MKLILGLGNPDLKYSKTRHNVGFLALDNIKNSPNSQESSFQDFYFDKNSNAKISKGIFNSKRMLLAKPQTYMNNSGYSAEKLINYYKLNPEDDLIVIYDDIDLPLGNIKTSGKSSGGHKGMQSIIDVLKTDNIHRIRVGILGKEKDKIKDTASYVLQNFNQLEEEIIKKSFTNIATLLKN